MSQITVRQANLADAASITDLSLASIDLWTRRDDDMNQTVPYDELTLFERWLVGGPWTSVEMCSVHLANLLRGTDGIPLVAEVEGSVGAEAEVFIGREAAPFGHHINLSRLAVHPNYDDFGLASALLIYVMQIGEAIHSERVTVADAGDDAPLLMHHGFQRTHTGRQLVIPTQGGRVFYKAAELTGFAPSRIEGWHMPLGRYQNAREEWDRMPPGFWNSVPPIVEIEAHRLHITITGQEAYALMRQDRDDPSRVHAFVWTKRPINNLLMMALRDWAARQNYDTIVTFAWDYVIPVLEVQTDSEGYTQQLYERAL